jgi:hypothetical protein
VNRPRKEATKSRRLAARAVQHEPSPEFLQEQQTNDNIVTDILANETSVASPDHNNDNSVDLPLLYSLARGWAWEAVTFRCTSHPHEVDVKYRDYRGDTILHWVAFGRPPYEVVHELLLKCPQLAQTPNHDGTLPLHVACSYRASSMAIQEILHAYPKAAAIPDRNGATPIHHLCDYGSGTGRETIAAMKVLLRCDPYGMQSVIMTDYRYQRRPIYILNARKNIREQEQYIETIRSRRFRQRAIRLEMMSSDDWNHHLKYELSDQLEEDINNIRRDSDFWKLVSCLIVAEYLLTFPVQDRSQISTVLDTFFGSDNAGAADICKGTNTSNLDKDAVDSIILHAFVCNRDCPQSLQEYAILLYEPYLMQPNPLSSFTNIHASLLPLHVAASMYTSIVAASGSTDRVSHLLSLLTDGCPEAASVRDMNDQLPLGLLLQRKQRSDEKTHQVHWSIGMQALIDVYPLALLDNDIDLFTHQQEALRPQLLSNLGRNRNTLYTLIRADPTLVSKVTRTNIPRSTNKS